MRPPVLVVAVAMSSLALTGCLGGSPLPDGTTSLPSLDAPTPEALNLSEPTHVIPVERSGYEPSILAGPNGTIVVTAHKDSLVREGEQLSSWLKVSRNAGRNWSDMPSPQTAHEKLWALEGDFAADDAGHIYYIDTWAADNTLSRWTVGSDGLTWDYSRPAQGTTGVDDRPWLAAQGDGVVYYIGNNGVDVPAPNNVQAQQTPGSRYWLYRSTDGGTTWSPGHGFNDVGWCTMETSPADTRTVYVGCDAPGYATSVVAALRGAVDGSEIDQHTVIFESTDQGQTWTRTRVGPVEEGITDGYPAATVDQAGTPYLAWPDGDPFEGVPTTLRFGRRLPNGTWDVVDATPFNGTIERVWASGYGNGTVALTFYGTQDADTGDGTVWHAYALVTRDATADEPGWELVKLDERPVDTGASSPADFFQNDVDADGVLHVAYQRDIAGLDPTRDPTHPASGSSDVLHVRTTLPLDDATG